ncbi:uncharacterized protein EI90DRAFT_3044829 [Cantharellus anzutake]|uniref:uncharacterized protein n=1 Tax=Cantharellus anzutake TaxID=1750568 RepID=UPI001908769F|nr:uncharacterized protein EI90DRAFT_3044829 [Cantharellus anzutake]KAF8337078.1 hypothetical protein EI90DRAFT_3044829 [Cantharellus anzutake]
MSNVHASAPITTGGDSNLRWLCGDPTLGTRNPVHPSVAGPKSPRSCGECDAGAPKMESLIWEESPHSWLENVAEATIPGSDTPSSPSPLPPAPKKRNKRASRNPQKQAAWLHWRENVIYKAVGIYLDLEAKKAGRISLGTPGETLFDENGCLCTPIASLCSRCNTYLRFHSLMMITSSSMLVSWLL